MYFILKISNPVNFGILVLFINIYIKKIHNFPFSRKNWLKQASKSDKPSGNRRPKLAKCFSKLMNQCNAHACIRTCHVTVVIIISSPLTSNRTHCYISQHLQHFCSHHIKNCLETLGLLCRTDMSPVCTA